MKSSCNKISKKNRDTKKNIKNILDQIKIKREEKENLKRKKKEAKTIVLFNNSPISYTKEDVFDFQIKAKAIKKAIDSKANLIALIGDYGAGKSSLTKLLYNKYWFSFRRPIIINLWDCFIKKDDIDKTVKKNDNKQEKESCSLSYFTKSFLYQLSSRNKRKTGFSRYINHRLSNNYGKLSFSVSTGYSIFLLFLCLIFFVLYLSFQNSNFVIYIDSLFHITYKQSWIKKVILLLSKSPYLFFFPMAISGFFALRNNSVLFSLWDSQGKIEPTDTDSFEVFKEITNYLRPRFPLIKRKQLVIIEDLDRSTDKEIVSQLLKEFYRFNNLLGEKEKNQFIFIVSLKSEQSLCNHSPSQETDIKLQKENLTLYSKIFDYTVWIRPLYFENIREIFETLLYSKFQNKKANEILAQLFWIMQGHNLTVREIKDRLNEVFLLHSSLSRRDKLDSDVKYNKCSAVVYLQRQYPKEFQELISHEKEFAEIVKNYYYKGELPTKEKFISIKDENFINDFIEMQKVKDIENDYAMYFFNYPKNAEIMTLEERYIYDAIIHNSYTPSEKDNINEMLDKIINNKKQRIIEKALKELMEYKHDFGEFVFDFERIFERAFEIKKDYTLLSLSKFVKENIKINKSIYYISTIYNYKCIQDDGLQRIAILSILIESTKEEYLKTKNKNFIEGMRINIIEFFQNTISSFSDLFINDNLPITDISTLSLLKNKKDIFACLNFGLVSQANLKQYMDYLSTIDFDIENHELLKNGLLSIPNLSSVNDSFILLRNLLMKNKMYEESLFEIVFAGYEKIKDEKAIIDYVQCIDYSLLSVSMLKKLDGLITKEITDLELIKLLESKELYNSSIYSRLFINNFEDFDFENTWIEANIKNLATIINEKDYDLFILLRITFLQHGGASKITFLFDPPFEFITEKEMQTIIEPEDLYWTTPFSQVTTDNCDLYSNYCNTKNLNSEKLFSFFEAIFFRDDKGNMINSAEIIKLILEKIDFTKCKFNTLKKEHQSKVITVFSPILELNTANNALSFMKTVNCHIESLDKLIQDSITSEDNELLVEYLEWCNFSPIVSDYFINFLSSNKIDMPLVPEITKELYKNKIYTPYIVGKSLNDNKVFYDDKISIENYYEAYSQSNKYFELAKDSSIIRKIHDAGIYDSLLSIEKLEPFRTLTRQSCHLIKLFFSKLQTNEERKQYFTKIPDIKSYKDCENLIFYLTQDLQLELFHNDYVFRDVVKEKLWETDDEGKDRKKVLKTKFTKTLNKALIRKYGDCN